MIDIKVSAKENNIMLEYGGKTSEVIAELVMGVFIAIKSISKSAEQNRNDVAMAVIAGIAKEIADSEQERDRKI